MSEESEPAEYEDIIRYEQKPLMFVSDEQANSLLWDLSYNPIIRILRQGPMTAREIEAEYNVIAETNENMEKKSDTTIYRYLKAFEKADLVAQAGRRVYFGKTATEILYCRTASVFLGRNLPPSYWNSDRGKQFFERVFSGMTKVYDDHEPIKRCLREFIPRFEKAKDDRVPLLLDHIDSDALETILDGDMWEIEQTFAYVRIFGLLLNQPEILEELLKCFKKAGTK
jgi:hypothetical protein